MNDQDRSLIAKYHQDKKTKAITLVRVHLEESQVLEKLEVMLPNAPSSKINLEAVTTSGYRVEIGEITNEVVEWIGSLKTPEREGSFSIVKIKDLPYFAGWFTWDGVQYELLPVKSSIAALRTMDMDYFQNTICGTKDDDVYVLNEGLVKSTPLTACDEPCSQFGAKIAAVLPPDYLDWLWEEFNHDNFYATLYHAIATQSFRNMLHMSGYPNAQITYIDHTISSFNYANPPNIDTELTTFASQNVGQHILLVTGADVAVLLTAQNYTNETGAAIIGGQFAVVVASFAGAGSWTFAHETGHMFKARHQYGNPGDNNPDCGHGYKFANGNEGITAMYAFPFGDTTIKAFRFSNPNITYNGYTIGTINQNSATRIATAMCSTGSVVIGHENEIEVRNDEISQNILVFPNPILNKLHITLSGNNKSIRIMIYDITGKLIFEQNSKNINQLNIDTRDWHPGIFTLKLFGDIPIKTYKIIKI